MNVDMFVNLVTILPKLMMVSWSVLFNVRMDITLLGKILYVISVLLHVLIVRDQQHAPNAYHIHLRLLHLLHLLYITSMIRPAYKPVQQPITRTHKPNSVLPAPFHVKTA